MRPCPCMPMLCPNRRYASQDQRHKPRKSEKALESEPKSTSERGSWGREGIVVQRREWIVKHVCLSNRSRRGWCKKAVELWCGWHRTFCRRTASSMTGLGVPCCCLASCWNALCIRGPGQSRCHLMAGGAEVEIRRSWPTKR